MILYFLFRNREILSVPCVVAMFNVCITDDLIWEHTIITQSTPVSGDAQYSSTSEGWVHTTDKRGIIMF